MQAKELQCKNCGGQLDATTAKSGVIACPYCGSSFVMPNTQNSKVLGLITLAQNYLDLCKFDDALSTFKKAVEIEPTEPQAWFGAALAEYKVQYIKDCVNNRLQPVCHNASDKKITENAEYKNALRYATKSQYDEYVRMADEIDYINKQFYAIKSTGLKYDCFICVKVTDGNGDKTDDAESASRLYDYLKDKGLSPFLSERVLHQKTGADYEAHILYALVSSPSMIIVCSNGEYLQTPWVKNEYTRFIELINDEQKEYDAIAICYDGVVVDRLPGRKGRLQGVDLGMPDAYSRIIDFVERKAESLNALHPIERKNYSDVKVAKRTAIRTGIKKRTLNTLGGSATVSASDASILKNTADFLANRKYSAAVQWADLLIENNPSNADAYVIKFLALNRCCTMSEYERSNFPSVGFDCFENAISATKDKKVKQTLLNMLYKHVNNTHECSAFEEYIAMPDARAIDVGRLSSAMLEYAEENKNVDLFNTAIATIKETVLFVEHCCKMGFVLNDNRLLSCSTDAVAYFRKALKYDEACDIALWFDFLYSKGLITAESGEENRRAVELFLNQANYAEIENCLFKYGFNAYAATRLIQIAGEHFASGDKNNAIALADFTLSTIPSDNGKIYVEYLNRLIEMALNSGLPMVAKRYNELIIAENPKDPMSHFNACMLNNGCRTAVELIKIGEDILHDDEFKLALNLYAEAFPDAPNIFMNAYMWYSENADLYAVPMAFDEVVKELKVSVKDLANARRIIAKAYDEKIKKTLCEFADKHNLPKLKKEVLSMSSVADGDYTLAFNEIWWINDYIGNDSRIARAFYFATAKQYMSKPEAFVVGEDPFKKLPSMPILKNEYSKERNLLTQLLNIKKHCSSSVENYIGNSSVENSLDDSTNSGQVKPQNKSKGIYWFLCGLALLLTIVIPPNVVYDYSGSVIGLHIWACVGVVVLSLAVYSSISKKLGTGQKENKTLCIVSGCIVIALALYVSLMFNIFN